MTPTPLETLEKALEIAAGIHSLPEPARTMDILKFWPELIAAALAFVRFHNGYATEHRELLAKVFELLGTITAFQQGEFHWATEMPQGKAPFFKRACNALISYINLRLKA